MKEDNINKLIDFSLEVSNGCQFNCTGCTIDKVNNDYPSDNEFDKIDYLIDDISKNGFKPMNLQLGPTDLMTASNMDQVLTDKRIKKLAKKFLKTAVNIAFLKPFDEDYIKLGNKLNWLLEGGLVKFVIPFEAYHIDNKEYIDKIRRRIEITLDNMPDVTHTKTYLIANYEATSIYDRTEKKNLTEELLLKTHESDLLEGFDVGFNLAHSRLDLQKPENAKKLYDSVIKLKNYYVNAKKKYGDRIDVYDLMPHEGTDWDIFYKSGKLYLTPFLLEAVTSFDEEFEVKKDWNFKGLYDAYLESFLNQVDWAHKNKDCQNCQFVPMCAERGVHSIMKLAKTNSCISPLKSLEDKIIWRNNSGSYY
jgi:hypothetical protein